MCRASAFRSNGAVEAVMKVVPPIKVNHVHKRRRDMDLHTSDPGFISILVQAKYSHVHLLHA